MKSRQSLNRTNSLLSSAYRTRYFERAWQQFNAYEHATIEIDTDSNVECESLITQPSPSILTVFTKLRVKNDAMVDAEQKLFAEATTNRCSQLKAMNEEQIAQEYLLISTASYDTACTNNHFQPNSTQRGVHIHGIAEKLALLDREKAQQCSDVRYPFDGIEQCYFRGFESGINGFCIPCSVKPDLYSIATGTVLDYKTGASGTTYKTHIKTITHAPKPESGVITNTDVTTKGVKRKYRSHI
jgi:hypothetical protein